MKYVNEEVIRKHCESTAKYTNDPDYADLVRYAGKIANIVNFFSEGAITVVSNRLLEHLENGGHLEYGLSDGCRCGCCNSYRIVDCEGEVVESFEILSELVEKNK
jgi:hypothetical protein